MFTVRSAPSLAIFKIPYGVGTTLLSPFGRRRSGRHREFKQSTQELIASKEVEPGFLWIQTLNVLGWKHGI